MKKGLIGLGVEIELLLEIQKAAEAVKVDTAAIEKVVEAAKVVMVVIEKADEAEKADLAEGIVKVNTAEIVKGVGAVKVIMAGTVKAAEVVKAVEAERAVMVAIRKEAVEGTVEVKTAEAVDMEANLEGVEASTGTAQKNIPVMTEEVQGKNQEANLEQGLTVLDS